MRSNFNCFAEMRHGTTIKNLCIRFKVGKELKLNIYRLVQFLCVNGIIRRIHKVPFFAENFTVPVVSIETLHAETDLREAAVRLFRFGYVAKCDREEESVGALRRHQDHGRDLRHHQPLHAGADGTLYLGAKLTPALSLYNL